MVEEFICCIFRTGVLCQLCNEIHDNEISRCNVHESITCILYSFSYD